MSRTLSFAVFFLSLGLVIGGYVGYRYGAAADITSRAEPTVAVSDVAPQVAVDDAIPSVFDHIAAENWSDVADYLERPEAAHEIDTLGAALAGALVVERVDPRAARALQRVIEKYLTLAPQDVDMWLNLARHVRERGRLDQAIENLRRALGVNSGVEEVARIRKVLDADLAQLDRDLAAGEQHAERERLWQGTVAAYPLSDHYRYRQAVALVDAGRWDAAERVLAETGVSDVSQEQLDALSARIERGRRTLGFTRQGDRILAVARGVTGVDLTLLVDTGATVTGLHRTALRRLGAEPLRREVRLQTANGVVVAQLFRVRDLEVQGHWLEDLTVVELPVNVPGVDGLLGLDVLETLGWSVDNL